MNNFLYIGASMVAEKKKTMKKKNKQRTIVNEKNLGHCTKNKAFHWEFL